MLTESYETENLTNFSIPETATFVDVTALVDVLYSGDEETTTEYRRYSAERVDCQKWNVNYDESECDFDSIELTTVELLNAIKGLGHREPYSTPNRFLISIKHREEED